MNIKYIKLLAISAIISSALFCLSLPVGAADVYYRRGTQETLAGGVVYRQDRMMTADGILDVYVLTVPLDNPGVSVSPVVPKQGGGYRQTSQDMLKDAGAIAGVNGDFFITIDGDYSANVGALIQDGKLRALNTTINGSDSKTGYTGYASFMLDGGGNPLIQYISSAMNFAVDGRVIMGVASLNRVSDLSVPVEITSDFMKNTKLMDSWVKDLTKIVVTGGAVTYISKKGETVDVPPDGYAIVLNSANADKYAPMIRVGGAAAVNTWASLDLSKIKMAIGGSARLLTDGAPTNDDAYFPSGLNPRTAAGYTKDGKKLILLAVDGRTQSVGVTKSGLTDLMLAYGAYNAVNLDGGGSTSMSVQLPAQGIRQTNNPSDGAPRRLANSLGVFFKGGLGQPVSMLIRPAADLIFKDVGAPIYTFALDANYQASPINFGDVDFSSDDKAGVFKNGNFYPSKLGDVTITAMNGGAKGSTVIKSLKLAQIIPVNASLTAFMGGSVPIRLTGVSADGYTAPLLAGITYTVNPAGLGHVKNGVFYPDKPGAGYIKCNAGALAAAYVNIGVSPPPGKKPVASFEDDTYGVSFAGYPEGVAGGASVTNAPAGGGASLKLDYTMPVSDATQAAYAVFRPPMKLPPSSQSVGVSVYGDSSFVWLRAKLVDAAGAAYTVDLARQVDWQGWKELAADIPQAAAQPVTLERVYAVTQGNADTTAHTLYFDNIYAVASESYAAAPRPKDTPYFDPCAAKLGAKPANAKDVTVLTDAVLSSPKKPDNYADVQKRAFALADADSAYTLFPGAGGDPKLPNAKYSFWTPKYALTSYSNADVISLNAAGGGLLAADAAQWASLTKDAAACKKPNIIIIINKSPLNFSLSEELDTFSRAMNDLISAGKTVVVISSENTSNWAKAYNGVHYFNLKGPYSGGAYDPSAQLLRLRFADGGMRYEFQDLGLK